MSPPGRATIGASTAAARARTTRAGSAGSPLSAKSPSSTRRAREIVEAQRRGEPSPAPGREASSAFRSERDAPLKAPRSRAPGASGRRARSSARRTSPRSPPRSVSPERDEVVEQRALDQRPEIAAHPHIGLEALGRAGLEAQRMFGVDRHDVVDIGAEHQVAASSVRPRRASRPPETARRRP